MSVVPARPPVRRVRPGLAALAVSVLTAGLCATGAVPALADEGPVTGADPAAAATVTEAATADAGPRPGTSLPVVEVPSPEGGQVTPMATIESAEEFCSWMTGIYDANPSSYTLRTINCRYTDVFVKGVYRNGGFGPCVLVPARHSRHLGGSLLKPLEKSQIC